MARTSAVVKLSSTRQRLIEAAHSLIWANSYAHVSVEDICREAGVQKGSFYHFFPTKADLAAAALEDHWQEIQPKLDGIFANNKTPQTQLKALCAEILSKQKEAMKTTGMVCGCPYATVGAELSSNNETMRALTQEMNTRFVGYFERLLKNAASIKLIPTTGIKPRASEMHTYVIGAMLNARLTNTLVPVGKSLETALLRIAGFSNVSSSARKPVAIVRKR